MCSERIQLSLHRERTYGENRRTTVKNLLEDYLASIAGYRKNRHGDLPEELRRRIANEWGRNFSEWGYDR
jgi:hypothetical protein